MGRYPALLTLSKVIWRRFVIHRWIFHGQLVRLIHWLLEQERLTVNFICSKQRENREYNEKWMCSVYWTQEGVPVVQPHQVRYRFVGPSFNGTPYIGYATTVPDWRHWELSVPNSVRRNVWMALIRRSGRVQAKVHIPYSIAYSLRVSIIGCTFCTVECDKSWNGEK